MPDYRTAFQDGAQYSISGSTGAIAAGAATKLIWYCRNASTSQLALVRRIEIEGMIATTAFAAGQVLYQLHIARAFTAEHASPTGTALTITGANQRLRAGMPSSALTVIRFAGTAPIATPAAWTLDSNPVGALNSHSSAGAAAAAPIIGNQHIPQEGVLFNADLASGEAPIVLGANEGLAVQITVPATGVWVCGINMKWAETAGLSV